MGGWRRNLSTFHPKNMMKPSSPDQTWTEDTADRRAGVHQYRFHTWPPENATSPLKLVGPHQVRRCLRLSPVFKSFTFAEFSAITGRTGRHNGWSGGTFNTKTGENRREIHQAKYSRAADRPKFSCHLVFYCPSLPPSPPDIRRKRLQGLLNTPHLILRLLSAAICSR